MEHPSGEFAKVCGSCQVQKRIIGLHGGCFCSQLNPDVRDSSSIQREPPLNFKGDARAQRVDIPRAGGDIRSSQKV